ncbi:putative glutamine amidotransferase subunit pdxT [Blastocladiella britannica]|nr:putative glutamine amidotransferase subunit pdxT [Blastocladiella britannica]
MTGPLGTTASNPLHIGVLALQGAFIEHIHMLERVAREQGLHLTISEVRTAAQLDPTTLHGLVLPGGESTAMALVAERSGCLDQLRAYVHAVPVWGTCAGMILLSTAAEHTKEGGQKLLGALDVTVDRNAFGRQADSFIGPLSIAGITTDTDSKPFSGVFIRAPVVTRVGDGVTVLGTVQHDNRDHGAVGERVVAVQQGTRILGTSFHPELTADVRVHAYFVAMVQAWWLARQQ